MIRIEFDISGVLSEATGLSGRQRAATFELNRVIYTCVHINTRTYVYAQ